MDIRDLLIRSSLVLGVGFGVLACKTDLEDFDPVVLDVAESRRHEAPDTCLPLGGGDAKVEFNRHAPCPDCQISNPELAIDGDLSSFATMTIPAHSGGSVSLRATAQNGVVFPAGSSAATVFGLDAGKYHGTVFAQQTYLGDQAQDNGGEQITVIYGTPKGAPRKQAFKTTKPFDALQFVFLRGEVNRTVNIQVYEFCVD